jgi:hypothetical protein
VVQGVDLWLIPVHCVVPGGSSNSSSGSHTTIAALAALVLWHSYMETYHVAERLD